MGSSVFNNIMNKSNNKNSKLAGAYKFLYMSPVTTTRYRNSPSARAESTAEVDDVSPEFLTLFWNHASFMWEEEDEA